MKYIISQTLFAACVLAAYFGFDMLRKREMKYKENRLFVALCFMSSLWSFGFFGVIIQTEPSKAYLWRAIGMIGTFGFLIIAQFLTCYLSGVKRVYRILTQGTALLGILLYFFVIQRNQVTYSLSRIGMTYSFESTVSNTVYIWYSVFMAFNQFWIIMYMIYRAKERRYKKLGKKLIFVVLAMVLGMALDTIFPLFGQPAIPGSTIGQFLALIVMYHTISFVNHSRVTIENMSEFVYYSLQTPVLVYDAKRELQFLNDAAFPFFGVYNISMTKSPIENIFEVNPDEVFEFEGNSHAMDAMCTTSQAGCSLSVNKIHDKYGDLIGYIIIITDLSERMKYMKRLEEASKEADNANRAKSTFLANMSHEIRTPMNAILGFSELALQSDIKPEVRGYVENIESASHNLLAIINDILDISRIESGKAELITEDYYIANLIKDVTVIIVPQAEKKNLMFELKVDESIPRKLCGDVVRLRSILVNLLNNAVKYTKVGKITCEVMIVKVKDNRIRLKFRVSDTGRGIKEDSIPTLFDSFERVDRSRDIEGTGLGLAIVKEYVNLMDGDVSVTSKYGEGSVFTVIIEQDIMDSAPVGKDYVYRRDKEKEEGFERLGVRDTRVLVVDDNPVNLKVAQGILSTYGMEADVAMEGAEAIEMCRHTNYDLVFMDHMMPEMNGTEAMKEIRILRDFYAVGGAGKIIVLTANAIKGTREVLMAEGFDEYLGKPINVERLEKILRMFIPEEKLSMQVPEEMVQESDEGLVEDLKQRLPKVDIEMGLEHCGGNPEDYLKVLEITLKHGEKQIQELLKLWDENDYKTYHIKIHALKSSLLNIGAVELSEAARKQEEACEKGRYDYVMQHISVLMPKVKALLDQIRAVLIHYEIVAESVDEEADNRPMMEEKVVLHMLSNIQNHIENFNFQPVFSALEEAKKYRIPERFEEPLIRIDELMDDLAVDEIKTILDKILAK